MGSALEEIVGDSIAALGAGSEGLGPDELAARLVALKQVVRRDRVRTVTLCRESADVVEELAGGRIGVAQVRELARARANPRVGPQILDALALLLGHARSLPFAELRICVQRWEALADVDGTHPAHQAVHDGRRAHASLVGDEFLLDASRACWTGWRSWRSSRGSRLASSRRSGPSCEPGSGRPRARRCWRIRPSWTSAGARRSTASRWHRPTSSPPAWSGTCDGSSSAPAGGRRPGPAVAVVHGVVPRRGPRAVPSMCLARVRAALHPGRPHRRLADIWTDRSGQRRSGLPAAQPAHVPGLHGVARRRRTLARPPPGRHRDHRRLRSCAARTDQVTWTRTRWTALLA